MLLDLKYFILLTNCVGIILETRYVCAQLQKKRVVARKLMRLIGYVIFGVQITFAKVLKDGSNGSLYGQ